MAENPLHDPLPLLRGQRHSFMNHLQVISGWLQLERSDRAMKYLMDLAARLSTESEVVRQVPAEVGLEVMVLGLEAESHGVKLDWRLHRPVEAINDPALRSAVGSSLVEASKLPEGERYLTVHLGPGQKFAVHMPPPLRESQL